MVVTESNMLEIHMLRSALADTSLNNLSRFKSFAQDLEQTTKERLTAPQIYGEREFQEWRDIGGATLSNNPTLTVSMAQHQTVLPVYMAAESGLPSLNQLSVAVNGNGTVTSTPSGIDCGSVCEAEFDADTPVTLTATPASGSTFTGWSGACTGMTTCVVTLDQALSAAATFSADTALSARERYALTFMQALAGDDATLNENLQAIFVRILARQLDEDVTGRVTESGAFAQLVQVFTFVASPLSQRPSSPLAYDSERLQAARDAAEAATAVATTRRSTHGYLPSVELPPTHDRLWDDSERYRIYIGTDQQIYQDDLWNETTTRLTQTASGQSGNGPSSHLIVAGDWVIYHTQATNLGEGPGLYRQHLYTGQRELIGRDRWGQPDPQASHPAASADGELIAYQRPDEQGRQHIYLTDTLSVERISLHADVELGLLDHCCVALSHDGQFIAYREQGIHGSEWLHILDRDTEQFTRLPWPEGLDQAPQFSLDSRRQLMGINDDHEIEINNPLSP